MNNTTKSGERQHKDMEHPTSELLDDTKGSDAPDDGKVVDIQVLRGIAIISVLLYHWSLPATLLGWMPVKATPPLYLGVELFFVISGYVIMRSLRRDRFSAKAFFIKRLFRLLPAIFVFLAVSAALNAWFLGPCPVEWARGAFSLQWDEFARQAQAIVCGYVTLIGGVSYYNGATWSLSIEDQFYAALTMLCLLASALRRPKVTSAIVGASAIAFWCALTSARVGIASGWNEGAIPWVAYCVHWRVDFLVLGIILALSEPLWKARIVARFASSGPTLAAYSLAVPLMIMALCESPYAGAQSVRHGVGYLLVEPCVGFAVCLAASNLIWPSTRGRMHKVLQVIGDRSYTIYLLHFPAFVGTWLVINATFPTLFQSSLGFGVAQILVSSVLMLPIVEFVYRRIELPMARLGRRIAHRHQESVALKVHREVDTGAALSRHGSRLIAIDASKTQASPAAA